MIATHLRIGALGALLGLMVAVTPSCQKTCTPDTCSGCCTSDNTCVTAVSATQCGTSGAQCTACSADQTCTDGACVAVNPMPDGGTMTPDAGPPPCTSDFDCADAQICSPSGVCVGAQASCNFDYECQATDPDDRCYQFGQGCVCDTGVCRLRKRACEECQTNKQCGDDPVIFADLGHGKCTAFPGDMSGKTYCSYRNTGQCQCGFVDDGTGFCRPQSNSCEQAGCNTDRDCSSGKVCSVNRPDAGASTCGGVCVPRCKWDFQTKRSEPACGPGQTCWVDSANLDENSPYYGNGRCKPACTDDAQCKKSDSNPFGGDNLRCQGEDVGGGATSDKRCRANGDCMDNLQCPENTDGGPAIGYCDRATFVCRGDCRTGTDPITNLPFRDCRTPYSCANEGSGNFCKLETCVEQGGATVACSRGQYCCGQDRNGDGVAEPCPPAADQNPAGCFDAPKPPFCNACENDNDCLALMHPAWATCSDGRTNVNCSVLKPVCRQAQGSMTKVCMMPTHNNVTTVDLRYGPVQVAALGCPTQYRVEFQRAERVNNACDNNEDCGPNGMCGPHPNVGSGPKPPKVCLCTTTANCPSIPGQNGPEQTMCQTPMGGGPMLCLNGNGQVPGVVPFPGNACEVDADCRILVDGGTKSVGACKPDLGSFYPDGGHPLHCECDAKSGTAQCPEVDSQGQTINAFCKDAPVGAKSQCITNVLCLPPAGAVNAPVEMGGCGL